MALTKSEAEWTETGACDSSLFIFDLASLIQKKIETPRKSVNNTARIDRTMTAGTKFVFVVFVSDTSESGDSWTEGES